MHALRRLTAGTFRRLQSEEQGIALVIVLVVLVALITLSTAIVAASVSSSQTSALYTNRSGAVAAAEAGLNVAVARLSEQPYDGTGSSSTILNECFTTTFVAQDSSGNCPAESESLGSLGSYRYYVSPSMASDTSCSSDGSTSTPCWTGHTTSSCTGYPVQGLSGLDISQRCITAIGTYNGVSERVQERVVDYEFTFPVAGLQSLTDINFDTNKPTSPYDGCPSAKHPPCPPVYLNGYFEANGKITIGGSAYSSEDVINGELDRGPGSTISLTDPTYNCPAAGSAASTLAYPGVTVSCSMPTPATANFQAAAGATESDFTSSATSNSDAALNAANPTHTGTSAPYQSSTRTFAVTSTNSSSTSPIIIPSGVYNFCSFSVNNGYIQINSGSHVIIYVDNSTTGDGCSSSNTIDGQFYTPTAGMINNNTNPNTFQVLICGKVNGTTPCGQWQGLGPCAGGASCKSASTITTTSNGGSQWWSQSPSFNVVLAGVDCATSTLCVTVGASGTIATSSTGGTSWTTQTSPTTNALNSVSCPGTTTCYAVGASGTIVSTTNGGTTWSTQTSGTTNALSYVSCPSTTTCYAVGASGTIKATTNGGSTWSTQTSGTTNTLDGISCPTTTTCFVVDAKGGIRATTNGGTTWVAQTSGTTAVLNAISCSSTTNCIVVGASGLIRATTNGGTTWAAQTSGTTNALNDVVCPSTTVCFADGASGTMLATSNDGTSWTVETSSTSAALNGVGCASTTVCVGVGATATPAAQTIGKVTLNDDLNSTGGPSGNGMTYGEIYAPDSAFTTTGNGLRWTGGIVAGDWESNDNDWLQASPFFSNNPTLSFYPVAYHQCSASSSTSDVTAGCY